jgi:hypothetical protein
MTENRQLETPKAAAIAQDISRAPDTFDDMHDTGEELQRYAPLQQPLEYCRRIADEFDAADKRAVTYQRIHRWLTSGAAIFGSLAVVLSIIGLGRSHQEIWPARSFPTKEILDSWETRFAGLAVAIVGLGWFGHYKDKWLLHRHRAESFRLLRYHFLTHPIYWRGPSEEARLWIETKLTAISSTTLARAVRDASPHGPFEGTQSRLPAPVLQSLTEYYLSKRLNPQKEYFANRSQRNEFSDWIRAYLPWFFFVSIVVVFFKYFAAETSPLWGDILAVLAALLPAVAAGVRTWRSAFEFSRNKGRFEAAHQALRDLERRLVNEGFAAVKADAGSATTSPPANIDAYPILRDLSWCEHILETEHREWLRLMYETEWFG